MYFAPAASRFNSADEDRVQGDLVATKPPGTQIRSQLVDVGQSRNIGEGQPIGCNRPPAALATMVSVFGMRLQELVRPGEIQMRSSPDRWRRRCGTAPMIMVCTSRL